MGKLSGIKLDVRKECARRGPSEGELVCLEGLVAKLGELEVPEGYKLRVRLTGRAVVVWFVKLREVQSA